jgi:3-oxoacyl-[acyl-carrier protein] reductase
MDRSVPIDEQTVLVTGASRGIGRATAIAFAREGASVAINYRSSEKAAESAAETARSAAPAGGDDQRVVTVQADVSDEDDVDAMFDSLDEQFNGVDTLVNNAGVLVESPVSDTPVADWDRTMDVNLRGPFLCVKRALPAMQRQGHGVVINTASTFGHVGESGFTHYAASKAGLIGFTRSLAHEVAPDVRVNAVAPGPVKTDMLPEGDENPDIPLQRAADPEEIAPTYLHLASPEGAFYTGQVLDPNGGERMY